MKQNGVSFRESSCVVLQVENEEILFGQIYNIYVVKDKLLLLLNLLNLLNTVDFSGHYHAFNVRNTSTYMYCWGSDMECI